jgi:hypothetical protein
MATGNFTLGWSNGTDANGELLEEGDTIQTSSDRL